MADRILNIKVSEKSGQCVVYVMSRDQRVKYNFALLNAIQEANAKNIPLYVLFFYYPKVKNRNYRHYKFMFEGLDELSDEFKNLKIPFYFVQNEKVNSIESLDPESVYFDFSPLRNPQNLMKRFAQNANCNTKVVDSHNIVPVWIASQKEEYGAYTLRPKIHKTIHKYLDEKFELEKLNTLNNLKPISENWTIYPDKKFFENLLKEFEYDSQYVSEFNGGYSQARNHLEAFVEEKISQYDEDRNNPTKSGQSNMSPYLHFGQISSLEVVLELLKNSKSSLEKILSKKDLNQTDLSISALVEEMVVRKELSDNFCYYNPKYDSFEGLKTWAKTSLNEHQKDKREFIYSFEELELSKTHDAAWNAAQNQMVISGKMHGYMRMYWCKKILEWTDSAQTAIKYAIYLNDKYSLDGYDPNGYVGILWSIGGIHDRGWFERPIFGKVRYMNYNGLKSKFKIKEYEDKYAGDKIQLQLT